MKFLHLTDLHVGYIDKTNPLISTEASIKQAISDIKKYHQDAEFCVITGDNVYQRTEENYLLAKKLLNELPIPVYWMVGNHDDRKLSQAILITENSFTDEYVQSSVTTSVGVFLLLDTQTLNSINGSYCEQRQAWLSAQIQEFNHLPVWLFTHHAPFATGLTELDDTGINTDDANALFEIISNHPNVKHLFFGHYHHAMSGQWKGIPFSSHRSMIMPPLAERNMEDEFGLVDGGPQFAVVEVENETTVVHYMDIAVHTG